MKYLVLSIIFGVALVALTSVAPSTAVARVSYPTSGYCPVGTCNLVGGKYARYPRNCRAENCARWTTK